MVVTNTKLVSVEDERGEGRFRTHPGGPGLRGKHSGVVVGERPGESSRILVHAF